MSITSNVRNTLFKNLPDVLMIFQSIGMDIGALENEVIPLTEERKIRNQEYNARYYAKNSEHIKTQKVIFRLENKDRIADYQHDYYMKNSEYIKAKKVKYHFENRDRINARKRAKRQAQKQQINGKI